jgi:hypothetical protein
VDWLNQELFLFPEFGCLKSLEIGTFRVNRCARMGVLFRTNTLSGDALRERCPVILGITLGTPGTLSTLGTL